MFTVISTGPWANPGRSSNLMEEAVYEYEGAGQTLKNLTFFTKTTILNFCLGGRYKYIMHCEYFPAIVVNSKP